MPPDKPMHTEPEFIVVYKSAGPLRAEIVKGLLESAGIPAMLQYESVGRTLGLVVDGMGEVKVLVPQDREQEAMDLIKEEAAE